MQHQTKRATCPITPGPSFIHCRSDINHTVHQIQDGHLDYRYHVAIELTRSRARGRPALVSLAGPSVVRFSDTCVERLCFTCCDLFVLFQGSTPTEAPDAPEYEFSFYFTHTDKGSACHCYC